MAGARNKHSRARGKAKVTRSQLRARVEASQNATVGHSPSVSRKRRAQTELERNAEEPDTETVFEDAYGDDYEEEHIASGEKPDGEIRDPMMVNDAVVFRPGKDKVGAGEKLVYDESAYDQFHRCTLEWPSLSFDFVCMNASGAYDNISPLAMQTYPMTATMVLGTQADVSAKNKLVCLKMSNLHRTRRPRKGKKTAAKSVGAEGASSDESSSEDEDDDDDDEMSDESHMLPSRNTILQNIDIKFDSIVNRVRTMPQHPNIVAAWSSSGRFYITDVAPALDVLNVDKGRRMSASTSISPSNIKPMYSFRGHGVEGYAMDWSRVVESNLLTGALNGSIYMTKATNREGAAFTTVPDRFIGHRQAVEDIQWSPNEQNVFASCSSDKSIRIWDTRERRRSALVVDGAHDADVNVISWNRMETHLIVSGGDEGLIKVWDLRHLTGGSNSVSTAAAEFKQHNAAITCVQWNDADASMLCAGSEDGCVSVWDLAVERDAEEELREGVVLSGAEEFPAQLLFVHMGQKNVKEAQWHPSCPSLIVSTAEDGLNVFQASNITASSLGS
ncbi:Glutamate-rich WD repeat-containing protein 1 [Gracilariopsis chorda]|uniref:Glutamate-rich WD repeat-containing protein 1 n=1 Tax=Gracilariopsis chorda TaxID=448386 RepID=A0A2V3IUB5_9FLOR|nr:Glutamate-rich WD repeat-containing protein 1 [Gracilariopsis chorda]|eukprot:PXF45307.1 Glutamate-rich WD repeat-containing protein 1 [Gracilariopsis chorda]